MAHLEYANYAGYGERAKDGFGYSQAVKIGNTIECSGQGGWTRGDEFTIPKDIAEEISQAFENVDVTVKTAGGAGWNDVYKVRTYHTMPLEEEVVNLVVSNLKKWCPNHQPLWTCVGVAKLALDGMRVEIEAIAHVKDAK